MTADEKPATSGRLGRVLNRGALAIAMVGLANAAILFWFLETTEAHGAAIYLVGRQKTLALEFVELVLLRGDRAESFDQALQGLMEEFDSTIALLKRGGRDAGAEIPPAPGVVAKEIEQIERDWEGLKNELIAVRRVAAENRIDAATLERVRAFAERLARDADAVVAALRDRRRVYRTTLAAVAGLSSLFFLTVSFVGARFVRSAIVKPASAVQALARRALERSPPPSLDLPPDHAFGGAVDAVVDLSARLEAVRSQRDEAQADYRAIFDNSLAGIYQISAAGGLVLANAALAKLLGYQTEEQMKREVVDAHRELFVDPEHRDRVTGKPRGAPLPIFETRMRHKDGSEVWVLESARPIQHDGSLGSEGIVVDITPRKKAADALRRLSGRLMQVQDEERRRLARELHDSMGQLLAAMKMNLTRLEDTMELAPEPAELLHDSVELCEEASRQTRTLSHLLHPPLLEELGLEHAIRDFAAGFQKRSGIAVDVEIAVPDRLPTQLETCLFRFVQECLTNVHRHSGSEYASIRFFRREGELIAQCRDRGGGMPPEVWREDGELDSVGVGLRGIQARLEQLDGRLAIESSAAGTTITAIVPTTDRKRDATGNERPRR